MQWLYFCSWYWIMAWLPNVMYNKTRILRNSEFFLAIIFSYMYMRIQNPAKNLTWTDLQFLEVNHFWKTLNLRCLSRFRIRLWHKLNKSMHGFYPAGIYLLKVNNRNTKVWNMFLTIKIPERRHWPHSGIFIVNLEHISHRFLVFLLLALNM